MSVPAVEKSASNETWEETTLRPASWIDHLFSWLAGLPGPLWLVYLLLGVILALPGHLVQWVDGSLGPGTIAPSRIFEASMLVILLALLNYLNASARKSVETFSPLLQENAGQIAALQHAIASIGRREGCLAAGLGILAGLGSLLSSPASWGLAPGASSGVVAVTALMAIMISVLGIVLIVHTYHQLRMVNRIHDRAVKINLWQRGPVYAFSTLTARTGVGIALIIYYYSFVAFTLDVYGSVELSPLDASMMAVMLLLAFASFILPLAGMQRKLKREKTRLLAEADQRFERTLDKLHEQLDSEHFDRLGGLKDTLNLLQIEREALSRISSWPWRPETLRGFLSSIAIPIIIWLTTTYLGRTLGF